WVADRTGHKSSVMINRYRRAARTVAELGLGDLRPLDEAIPEVAAMASGMASDPPGGEERKCQGSPVVAPVGLEPTCPFGPRILNPGETPPRAPDRADPAASSPIVGTGSALVAVAAGQSEASAARSPSPREWLLAQLAEGVVRAMAAGDLEAARLAHDAQGRLLGVATGDVAPVIDLADARGKRGGTCS